MKYIADIRQIRGIGKTLDKRIRIPVIIMLVIALIASAYGLYDAYQQPTTTEEEIPTFTFDHKGDLNYSVKLKPDSSGESAALGPGQTYTTDTVEYIDASASYQFTGDQPAEISGMYDIVAQIQAEGVPAKRFPLVPEAEERIPIYTYEHNGNIDYTVHLKPNSLYEASTLGAGQTYFTNLIDYIDASASYEFRGDKPADIAGTYTIDAYVESDDFPRKRFPIVPRSDAHPPLFKFEHRSNLDYTVYLKPNSLYETSALGPGETYFTTLVDHIVCSASYDFGGDKPSEIKGTYEIIGTVVAEGLWEKASIIVPETAFEANGTATTINTTFPLDLADFRALSATIASETGTIAKMPNLVIAFVVNTDAKADSGSIQDRLVSTMVIPLGGNTFTISGDLSQNNVRFIEDEVSRTAQAAFSSNGQTAAFNENFSLNLAQFSEFLATIKNETGVLARNPRLVIEFNVRTSADTEGDSIMESLTPTMIIPLSGNSFSIGGEPSKSKTDSIVRTEKGPSTIEFTSEEDSVLRRENFRLDLTRYKELFGEMSREAGVIARNPKLVVTFNVQTTVDTDGGTVNEALSPTMVIPLIGSTFSIEGDLMQNSSGSVTRTQTITLQSALDARLYWLIPTIVFFVLVLGFMVLTKNKPVLIDAIEKEVSVISKKHGDRIAEATYQAASEDGKTVFLDSMEDLIKIADELAKPIIHQAPRSSELSHGYSVFDGSTIYEYRLTTDSIEQSH